MKTSSSVGTDRGEYEYDMAYDIQFMLLEHNTFHEIEWHRRGASLVSFRQLPLKQTTCYKAGEHSTTEPPMLAQP